MEATTGLPSSRMRRMASWISWVGPTTPPGLWMRTTSARTAGSSASWVSSRTVRVASTMSPSTSTTATRPPAKRLDPGRPSHRKARTITKQPTNTSAVTPSARPKRRRMPGPPPLLVVIVAVPVALPAPAATPAAPVLLLLHHHVRRQVAQRETDATLVRLDPDDLDRQLVPELDDVLGPRHRPRRHLRDVEQAVHPGLQLDEGAELGEPHDLAADVGPDRELPRDVLPGVPLELLQAERDPLVLLVDVQDHRL